MAKQPINIGAAPNDGTGDPLRTAFDKVNDNFDELYTTTGTAIQPGDTLPVSDIEGAAGTAVANTFTANQIISVTDNTNAALRITQAGTGNALVVEDSANPDSTPFVIDAAGNIGIGTSAPSQKLEVSNGGLQVASSVANSIILQTSVANANDSHFIFRKARGGATLASIEANDDLGIVEWQGYDGTTWTQAGSISCDSTSATGNFDAYLVFGIGGVQRMRINHSGNVLIATGTDNNSGAKLQVNGTITTIDGTAALPAYSNTDDPNTGVYFPLADTVCIATNGTERTRIDSEGNIGIGTNTISARTHIVSTTEQLRLGYDATKYATWTVNSSGDLAIDPVGKLDITGATKYVLGKEIDFEVGAGVIGWRDLIADIQIRNNPATDPTWAQIGTSPFWAYRFNVGDKVWITFHINHDYYPGGQILLHTHWLSSGTDTTNAVKWQFTYSVMKGHNQTGGDLSTTGTVVTAENVSGGQYRHMISEIASSITVTNAEVDSLICVVIERITNGATDNADNIFLLTADCHYQASRFATSQKSPNFYA